jgi:hypothetical protein
VPSVLLLESGAITPSGVLVCRFFNVGMSREIMCAFFFAVGVRRDHTE